MKAIIKIFAVLMAFQLPHTPVLANLPKNIIDILPSAKIDKGGIVLKAPDIAENGAVVTITIERILLKNKKLYVKEIWLFDHFRKAPIAHYKLGENALADGLTARHKLVGTSVIYAIALLSDGSMVSGEKAVRVTVGGCGNGGSTVTGQHYVAPSYIPALPQAHSSYAGLSSIRQHVTLSQDTEKYAHLENNGIIQVLQNPVSTFSVDVDSGSYSNMRRFLLQQGRLPVSDAVRVEEMINYFPYHYQAPQDRKVPFAVTTEIGPAPWNAGTHLLQIGLQGYRQERRELPAANIVFLVDVSGSMHSHDKLGLLKASLRMFARQLDEQDRIAIVVYAGASGVVLNTTRGDETRRITAALDSLSAGGSTNGAAGIQLAYALAQQSFIKNGINRVILATDGDFNVGTVDHQALIDLIKRQRQSGVSLTTLGFGTGNYNERLMEQLADHGDGNYAYIDTLREARKVLVTQLTSTLFTIAKDVKIQVEFNPAIVAEYRLIGYENRKLRREDFNNDKVDAGDIGAGHTVTALYEIAFVGSSGQSIEPLRYARKKPSVSHRNEVAFVRMRFKVPGEDASRQLSHPVYREEVLQDINHMSDNFRFAAAVAAFGQLLRNNAHIQAMDFQQVYALANNALGHDHKGYRREFLEMVDAAASLN